MTAAYLYNQKNEEYEMEKQVEQVLALHLPANVIDFSKFTNGLCTERLTTCGILQKILRCEHMGFFNRDEIEQDESYLQIIPYVVLKHKNRVFAYQRTKKSGEKRLHGNWSIGVGGHVNRDDANYNRHEMPLTSSYDPEKNFAFWNCVNRELKEEVGAVPDKFDLAALIFDPSNAVGRVHLGVVYVAEVNHTIRPIENSMGAHGFFSWEELTKSNNISYENWTKILLTYGHPIV